MIRKMLDFAGGIYYDNKPYTPKQVADYIAATECRGLVLECQFELIMNSSQNRLEALVKQHGLKQDKQLQANTSTAGKELATLALEHYVKCDKLVKAVTENMGILF